MRLLVCVGLLGDKYLEEPAGSAAAVLLDVVDRSGDGDDLIVGLPPIAVVRLLLIVAAVGFVGSGGIDRSTGAALLVLLGCNA